MIVNGPKSDCTTRSRSASQRLRKIRVQLIEIGHARHRRGESALHGLDGPLGVGLLVAASRHAEERLEDVVAGQRRVSRMKLAFASQEDQRGDGLGVVPPDLLGDAAEELEGRDHAFEDRLGALEGQRQHEGSVGVGPGRDQERHEPAAVGEVDVDVSEIGFEALAREMSQRDERFLMPTSVLAQIALHLGIAAAVAVLVAEATEDLRGGVPLLGRAVSSSTRIWSMIAWKGPRTGANRFLVRGMGLGSACLRILPDGVSRVFEFAGDLPDGHAIATRPPNGTVVVHRKHVLALRASE